MNLRKSANQPVSTANNHQHHPEHIVNILGKYSS